MSNLKNKISINLSIDQIINWYFGDVWFKKIDNTDEYDVFIEENKKNECIQMLNKQMQECNIREKNYKQQNTYTKIIRKSIESEKNEIQKHLIFLYESGAYINYIWNYDYDYDEYSITRNVCEQSGLKFKYKDLHQSIKGGNTLFLKNLFDEKKIVYTEEPENIQKFDMSKLKMKVPEDLYADQIIESYLGSVWFKRIDNSKCYEVFIEKNHKLDCVRTLNEMMQYLDNIKTSDKKIIDYIEEKKYEFQRHLNFLYESGTYIDCISNYNLDYNECTITREVCEESMLIFDYRDLRQSLNGKNQLFLKNLLDNEKIIYYDKQQDKKNKKYV